jgi:hypothetical protein
VCCHGESRAPGEHVGLIDLSRATSCAIHLLQQHHIRARCTYDLRDACKVVSAGSVLARMDVVDEDAELTRTRRCQWASARRDKGEDERDQRGI